MTNNDNTSAAWTPDKGWHEVTEDERKALQAQAIQRITRGTTDEQITEWQDALHATEEGFFYRGPRKVTIETLMTEATESAEDERAGTIEALIESGMTPEEAEATQTWYESAVAQGRFAKFRADLASLDHKGDD